MMVPNKLMRRYVGMNNVLDVIMKLLHVVGSMSFLDDEVSTNYQDHTFWFA